MEKIGIGYIVLGLLFYCASVLAAFLLGAFMAAWRIYEKFDVLEKAPTLEEQDQIIRDVNKTIKESL
jgi:hypothetical protein